jgi:hypothetical protein
MKMWLFNTNLWWIAFVSYRWNIFNSKYNVKTFVDIRLYITKQTYNEFMAGLDIIMASNFYQALIVWDSWIF